MLKLTEIETHNSAEYLLQKLGVKESELEANDLQLQAKDAQLEAKE